MNISFIGYKNHSLRLLNIFKSILINEDYQFYIYHPNINKLKQFINANKADIYTSDFSKILKSKIVVIASPTSTHYYYIEKLVSFSFKGYIFVKNLPVHP